ncbi:hypothetical protein W824_07810 [Clavibacter cf. michiganensis LMG 26808]|nr:hypothetical protein W824_07810 [Clavibacter cf. michiganensis LMG 26808]
MLRSSSVTSPARAASRPPRTCVTTSRASSQRWQPGLPTRVRTVALIRPA